MCTVLGVKPHQFADVCFLVEGYAFSKDPEKHVAQKHCNGHAIRIDHLSHCGFSGITSQKLDNCKGIIRKSLEWNQAEGSLSSTHTAHKPDT